MADQTGYMLPQEQRLQAHKHNNRDAIEVHSPSRRQFLTYTGIGAGLTAAPGFTRRVLAQTDVRVRQDVGALAADGEVLTAYRDAIAAMRARPDSDPTGWTFQANIHGSFDSSNPAWNQCQHGSFLFLSWHRMYLYFFERIIREASGNSEFGLPYWNYRLASQRQVPEPFRQSADPAANMLFIEERNPAANAGGFLPESAVLHDQAFSFTNFTSPNGSGQSFGGQQVGGFTHFAQPHGQIESQPHDIIHVLIGGQTGFMVDPRLAARDPIFWLHHSNIDRLWNRWLDLGNGRENPMDDGPWADTEFNFFDENGDQVVLTGKDVVDTATQLDYRYDDDPIVDPDPAEPPCPEPAPLNESVSSPRVLMESAETTALGEKASSVKLQGLEESSGSLLNRVVTDESGARSLILRIEGIDYDDQPGVYYEVYINLPGEGDPSHRSRYYIGNITFFAIKPHHGGEEGGIQTFDITRAVRELAGDSDWDPNDINVSFVKRDLETDLEFSRDAPSARIGKISIIRE